MLNFINGWLATDFLLSLLGFKAHFFSIDQFFVNCIPSVHPHGFQHSDEEKTSKSFASCNTATHNSVNSKKIWLIFLTRTGWGVTFIWVASCKMVKWLCLGQKLPIFFQMPQFEAFEGILFGRRNLLVQTSCKRLKKLQTEMPQFEAFQGGLGQSLSYV